MKRKYFKWDRDKIDSIIKDCGFTLKNEYGGIYDIELNKNRFLIYLHRSSIEIVKGYVIANKIYTYKEFIRQLNKIFKRCNNV